MEKGEKNTKKKKEKKKLSHILLNYNCCCFTTTYIYCFTQHHTIILAKNTTALNLPCKPRQFETGFVRVQQYHHLSTLGP